MTGIFYLDMAIGLFIIAVLLTLVTWLDARRGEG